MAPIGHGTEETETIPTFTTIQELSAVHRNVLYISTLFSFVRTRSAYLLTSQDQSVPMPLCLANLLYLTVIHTGRIFPQSYEFPKTISP